MSNTESKIKLDLITGLLGSGKTTFTKRYVHYLTQKEKVGIIVNDFGGVNVDMMMLKELRGPLVEIEMVSAVDEDCYIRRLKSKLISLKLQGFKHVLIEPSGLFNINTFMDLLNESPLNDWYVLNTIIGIVDASNTISDENMKYLFIDEIINAGSLVVSKTQLVEDVSSSISQLDRILHEYNSELSDYVLIDKNWDDLNDEDFNNIESAPIKNHTIKKQEINDYQNLFFFNLSYTKYELTLKINKLFETQNIHRIKGFMTLQEGYIVSINVTKNEFEIKPVSEGQEVLLVIGETLDENYINSIFN